MLRYQARDIRNDEKERELKIRCISDRIRESRVDWQEHVQKLEMKGIIIWHLIIALWKSETLKG